MPPYIDALLQEAIYRGLLENRRLDVEYRSREKGEMTHYEVNPLALVFKGSIAYLVCTLWNYTDIRQLALHRLQRAAVLEAPATVPAGFDLDYFLQDGEFSYPVGQPIRLGAIFSQGVAFRLYEMPLTDWVLAHL
jgi:predicted DNA-binding transcriptional regulator YafY